MKAMERSKYVIRQDLWEAEEQVKRRWKLLLVLLALALQGRPEAPAGTGRVQAGGPARLAGVAKVLLMDTDPASSEELANMLEMAGFEVMISLEPEEALQRLTDVSLVILDEELPSCEEVCSHIRQQSGVPIILLGSSSNGRAWNRAVAIGADAYLKRALSRRELLARIRAILRRYQRVKYPEGGETNV